MDEMAVTTLLGDASEPSMVRHTREGGERVRGEQLGRYTILELKGRGGMGLVYSAYDPQLDRRVAVKVLHRDVARSGSERARTQLLREAQAMARLSHPNVVAVHDVGLVDDEVFVAMEFIDGPSLDRWLEQQPRSWRTIVEVFVEAGRGLAAAHMAGLVHRDFKPANVLVDSDLADRAERADRRVRVTDFGLAYSASVPSIGAGDEIDSQSDLVPILDAPTDGGHPAGTPAYMAPEQHHRTELDARTDQFGFCVALYEALFGQHPFGGTTMPEFVRAVTGGELRPPPADTKVPAHVRRAVMRGLSHAPSERWPSMEALLAALTDDPARRRRRVALAGVAVAGVAGLVALASRPRPAPPVPPPPCEGAGAQVYEVWSDSRRAAIFDRFAATGLPFAGALWSRIAEVFDAYAVRWSASALDACEATRVRGEQSDTLFDLRQACLSRRLGELDAHLAMFDEVDEVDEALLDHGFELAVSLTPVVTCEQTRRLQERVPLPEDPALRSRVVELRGRLDRLRAGHAAGRDAAIEDAVMALEQEVQTVEHAPLRGAVRLLAAAVHETLGRWKESEALLRQALVDAGQGHDDRLRAQILVVMPYLVGYLQARPADAELLEPSARASIARLDDPGMLPVLLEQRMGLVRFRQRDFPAARGHYQRALELCEGNNAALQHATVLHALAVLEMYEGQLERARSLFEQAYALRRELLRPDHPDFAAYHQNLGSIAAGRGDYRLAVEHYDRALWLLRSSQPDGSSDTVTLLINRSQILTPLRRFEESRANVEEAMALASTLYGPDHPAAFAAYLSLARLESEQENFEEARAAITRAQSLAGPIMGTGSAEYGLLVFEQGVIEHAAGNHARALALADEALALSGDKYQGKQEQGAILALRGKIALAQGRSDDARAHLDQAARIFEGPDGDQYMLAEARFDLARCLADRQRALALARQAQRFFVEAEHQEQSAEVGAWLAAATK
ncbi:MAG: serine/threonine-protein kinase [Myxococcota bacterium]